VPAEVHGVGDAVFVDGGGGGVGGLAVGVDVGGDGGVDEGLAAVGLAFVAEQQQVAVDAGVVLALLLEVVLDLEQVGEVGGGVQAQAQRDGGGAVVEDGEFLAEAVDDLAAADDRQGRVDVDGAGAGHEEEPGLEVVQVVGRQRVEAVPVQGEHPAGQVAGVPGEQAVGFGG
jgi:hypothetical protein